MARFPPIAFAASCIRWWSVGLISAKMLRTVPYARVPLRNGSMGHAESFLGDRESENAGQDITHRLDRDNCLVQSIMDSQPSLLPACDVISQDSYHRGLVAVRPESPCWVWPGSRAEEGYKGS